MKMIFRILYLALFFGFYSSRVLALTPPLSALELEKESDIIVEGRVEDSVACVGQVEKTPCFDKKQYSAKLTLLKVEKGKVQTGQSIPVTFFYNDYSKSACSGDQYGILGVGDDGRFYLKKNPDGTYSPVHWSGVQVKKHGMSLPKCP